MAYSLTYDLINNTKYSVTGYTGEPVDILIPSSYKKKPVTSIGDHAFGGCDSLTSITIPNSVTSIGYGAFTNCSSLTSITIPDSVTSIGSGAFQYCTSLTSITIPFVGAMIDGSDSTHFGYIFGASSGRNNSSYVPSSLKTVVITGGTSIRADAFYNCSSLTSITIPDSVTSIGSSAFQSCSSLTNVTIPNSVKSIGSSAFQNCSSLTNVTIPNSVKSISLAAFYGCSGLTSVTIGNGVTSIGSTAFQNCYKLIEIKNLSTLGITAGSSSYGYVGYYAKRVYTEGESYLSTDENGYIIYNDDTDKILVGYTGTETDLTLPSGITQIYKYMFYNRSSSLTNVTIPNSVTSIGSSAFQNCSSLTNVTIPDSVTSIGYEAFRNCSSLTSVTIPDSVTNIGDYAFANCTHLKQLILLPSSPPTLGSTNAIPTTTTIYVQQSSKEAYKTAPNWKPFANKIVADDMRLYFTMNARASKAFLISKAELKSIVSNSSSFDDFKSKIKELL